MSGLWIQQEASVTDTQPSSLGASPTEAHQSRSFASVALKEESCLVFPHFLFEYRKLNLDGVRLNLVVLRANSKSLTKYH
jgi:hypothetical protein